MTTKLQIIKIIYEFFNKMQILPNLGSFLFSSFFGIQIFCKIRHFQPDKIMLMKKNNVAPKITNKPLIKPDFFASCEISVDNISIVAT